MSVEIDEFDKYITGEKELLDGLFKSYDNGDWTPKVTSGQQLASSIQGVAPNFIGMATPDAMLLNKEVSEPFRNMLASGFARRTFFYYEDDDKLPYIPTAEDLENMEATAIELKEKAQELSDRFTDMMVPENLEKVLPFNKKSKMMMQEFRSKSMEFASQTQDPIMNAEYRERHFKVAKLAGVYAFIDGNNEVQPDNVEYAIAMAEHSTASLMRIGDSKSMIERLYLRIRSEEGFVHTQDMLNYGLISKSHTNKIKEYAEELEAYADVYGDIIEVMKDGKNQISAVRVTQLINTDPDACILSFSNQRRGRDGEFHYNHDSGYKKVEIPFENIVKYVTDDRKVCYAPVGFHGGRRLKDKTEAYSNLIVMDIDEGMTLDYAKEIFKDHYAIIHTTRSHQIEKNETVCDRFRVILLANKYLFTTPDKYDKMLKNVKQFYNITMDEACFDKSHVYYSNNGDVWMGKCLKKFDVAKLIPSDDDHISKKLEKKSIQSFRPDGGKALKMYFENKVATACKEGTGIINALAEAMLAVNDNLADQFMDVEYAEAWLDDMASCAPQSYWVKHDMESEIFSKLRTRWNLKHK
jgi:hypothetical protein